MATLLDALLEAFGYTPPKQPPNRFAEDVETFRPSTNIEDRRPDMGPPQFVSPWKKFDQTRKDAPHGR